MDKELRKRPRKKPLNLIYVEFGSDNGGMMRDLSENGMGFRSVGPLPNGAKIPFSFSLGPGRMITGEVELVWTDEGGRSGGMSFVSPESVATQIRAWMEREERRLAEAKIEAKPEVTGTTLEELRKELRATMAPKIEKIQSQPGAASVGPVLPTAIPRERSRVSPEPERREIPSAVAIASPVLPVQQPLPPQSFPTPAPPPLSPAVTPPHAETNLPFDTPVLFQGTLTETESRPTSALSWVILAMLLLTLAATGLVYHHELGLALMWAGGKITGSENPSGALPEAQPSTDSTQDSTQNATQNPTQNPANDSVQDSARSAPAKAAESTAKAPASLPSNAPVRKPNSSATWSASAAGRPKRAEPETAAPENQQINEQDGGNSGNTLTNSEPGQAELQKAQRILRNEESPGNNSEAVRLLWESVQRGNSEAEVALADLYRTGEGVTQNCDQMRVLLTAAARKGNSQAKERLVETARTGCP